MKLKKCIGMFMVILLTCSMVFGCARADSEIASKADSEADSETAAAGPDSGLENGQTYGDGAITNINMLIVDESSVAEKKGAVEAAVNVLTESQIGVHVNMTYVEWGAYANQVTMALSGGEQIDLAVLTPSPSASFSTLASMGGLTDISQYIKDSEIETLLGDYLKATTIDGKVLGVPAYRMLSSSQYVIMRKDILESLGLVELAQNMTTWKEFDQICQAVLESQYDVAPIGANGNTGRLSFLDAPDNFSDTLVYDDIADSLALVAVNLDDPTNTVYNFYASDTYYNELARVKDWYEKGYMYKDAAITEESGDSLIKTGAIFSYVIGAEYGTEATRKANTGYDCVCTPITDIPIATSTCTKFVWVVPSTAVEVEAAVKMMNLMYTSSELANLLAWGIEGQDYIVTENGTAAFPESVTSENVNYHTSDYLWGNQFLILPWGESADPELRKNQKSIMDKATISPYIGFSCDTSVISNPIAACNSVISEYRAALQSGAVDLSLYDTFIDELDKAGANDILAEYQKQLNEWLAANK